MITFDITSNIEEQLRGAEQFAARLDGVFAQALNSTAFEVRRQIVEVTYGRSFDVRNRSLPRRIWQIRPATKGNLVADVEQTLDREWLSKQAEGGTKTPRHASVAIPVAPETVRAPTGRVRAPLKPLAIVKRKGYFLLGKGANKKAIVRRKRGSDALETVYIFQKSAHIPKRFPFYEDAMDRAVYHFPRYAEQYLERLIIKSVFSAGP